MNRKKIISIAVINLLICSALISILLVKKHREESTLQYHQSDSHKSKVDTYLENLSNQLKDAAEKEKIALSYLPGRNTDELEIITASYYPVDAAPDKDPAWNIKITSQHNSLDKTDLLMGMDLQIVNGPNDYSFASVLTKHSGHGIYSSASVEVGDSPVVILSNKMGDQPHIVTNTTLPESVANQTISADFPEDVFPESEEDLIETEQLLFDMINNLNLPK